MDISSLLSSAKSIGKTEAGRGDERKDEEFEKLFGEVFSVDDAKERANQAVEDAKSTVGSGVDRSAGVSAEIGAAEGGSAADPAARGLEVFGPQNEPVVVDKNTTAAVVESRLEAGARAMTENGGTDKTLKPGGAEESKSLFDKTNEQQQKTGPANADNGKTRAAEARLAAAQDGRAQSANAQQGATVVKTDGQPALVSRPTPNLAPNALQAALGGGAEQGADGDAGGQPFGTPNQNNGLVAAQAQLARASAQARAAVQAQVQASGVRGAQAPAASQPVNAPLPMPSDASALAQSQPSQQTAQTRQPAASQTPNQARNAAHNQALADQVSVQIQRAVRNGVDRINIQLKPQHLGRIDVSMEVSSDGRMLAVVQADNADTLDLLMKNAGDLERSLQQAGLKLDAGGLSFAMTGEDKRYSADGQEIAGFGATADEDGAEEEAELAQFLERNDEDGVDLRV